MGQEVIELPCEKCGHEIPHGNFLCNCDECYKRTVDGPEIETCTLDAHTGWCKMHSKPSPHKQRSANYVSPHTVKALTEQEKQAEYNHVDNCDICKTLIAVSTQEIQPLRSIPGFQEFFDKVKDAVAPPEKEI